MLSKEKFRDYFEKDLCKKLKTDNNKIIVCRVIMFFTLLTCFTFLLWTIILLLCVKFDSRTMLFIPIVSVVSMAVSLIVFICYIHILGRIEKAIVGPILYKIFEGDKVIYDRKRHLGKKELLESGVVKIDYNNIFNDSRFSAPFRVEGEDYFEIEIKGEDQPVNIKVSDISIVEREVNMEGKSEDRVTDRGIFGIIDFNKEVKTEILGNFKARGFEEVELESKEFNEAFTCYAKDQIEVRKVLTPRTMARLLKLKDKVSAKPRFHLTGTKMYFLVNKNLFKYKVKGLIDFGEAEQIYDQAYIIYQIASELAKNEKIFK